jgi:hypothetical protein
VHQNKVRVRKIEGGVVQDRQVRPRVMNERAVPQIGVDQPGPRNHGRRDIDPDSLAEGDPERAREPSDPAPEV